MTTWYRLDGLTPKEIWDALPSKPKLGEHIGRTATLDKDRWLIVQFGQDGEPKYYMIVPNPPKLRGHS